MLAGLGLAVGEGEIAGRSDIDTGDGIKSPSSVSLECRIPWGLGMGEAGTAGNASADSEWPVTRSEHDINIQSAAGYVTTARGTCGGKNQFQGYKSAVEHAMPAHVPPNAATLCDALHTICFCVRTCFSKQACFTFTMECSAV